MESYVDDSKLYLKFPLKEANTAMAQLSEDLKNIAAWCCSNNLLINPDKTKLLVFGTRRMLEKVQVILKHRFLVKNCCTCLLLRLWVLLSIWFKL